ncbi:MAG: FecR domain-containing protein [Arcobacteraceae bacterium]|nr:FecR domain-containing protein [Arcobacteraceae bacterium]
MRIIFLLFFLISSVFANVAIISAFKGKAVVIRDGKSLDAKIGFKLKKNDQLKTQDNTKLQLIFTDNTIITVGKNSDFSIQEYIYDEQNIQKVEAKFNFAKGLFRTVTGQIGKINPNKFKIKVKSATIGIRGTRFDVFVSSLKLKVGLFQGKIYLLQNKEFTTLLPGQMLVYTFGAKVEVKEGVLEESKELNKASVKKAIKKAVKKESAKKVTLSAKTIKKYFDQKGITEETVKDIINTFVDSDLEDILDIFDIETLTQAELDKYLTNDIITKLEEYETPTSVIDGYIEQSSTASYTGNIVGVVNEENALSGTLTLNIDFMSKGVTGEIFMTNFNTIISNTELDVYNSGFTATVFDSMASGSMIGKFYGDNAGVVGGTILLTNENTDSFVGSFIGN